MRDWRVANKLLQRGETAMLGAVGLVLKEVRASAPVMVKSKSILGNQGMASLGAGLAMFRC
jgi:hypothetical protein